METAQAIANALDAPLASLVEIEKGRTLSPKTVREYHNLISTVLTQALKEGLVPFNVAQRATPPRVPHKAVNYFQPEEIVAIRDALEKEPIKWKTLVHLLLITGARRGEVLGLKWSNVDLDNCKLHICNTILYTSGRGVYEETPKTEQSNRFIIIPKDTAALLKQYRAWQYSERLRLGEYFKNQDFVFSRDDGSPLRPDSVSIWLTKFSERHGLRHINAHAFRHTMASLLYFNGMDSVSISHRLGHSQVSTTK
ncbi:MAG: site-specific integrase, partial [Oscillospiraceae bacterium]|nr:site-specific integrase [Oscillospiraceae bacterium]